MQHSILRSNLGQRITAVLATAVTPALLWAQVSLYSFSQTVETYTELTDTQASHSLGVPTWWPPLYNQRAWTNHSFYGVEGQVCSYLNPATGPGYPIGFDFRFNGDVFDRISVSHSGFITFGKSSDGDQAVWTYAIDHPHGAPFVQFYGGPTESYQRNRVAGWGSGQLYMQDMTPQVPPGPVSNLRIGTIGAAPNRVCVVQYKDFLMAYPPSSSRVNFQIRLNEADNSVEVRYGQVLVTGGTYAQVGLGGRSPEDFNSRMTVYEEPDFLYDLNNTTAGPLNTDACYIVAEQPGHPNGTGIPPAVGLNFKWTPSACPPPAWPVTVSDITFQSALVTWEATAAQGYEYFVSDTNLITGPEIASGTTPDPEAPIEGLQPMTMYYVFVRSICDGEPGIWSLGTPFRSMGGGMVVCDGTTMQENYCSHQNDVVSWLYVSEDGSPIKLEILGGVISNGDGEYFKIWTAAGPVGAAAFEGTGAQLVGQSVTSADGVLYIELATTVGSCESQNWFLPLQWRVGCKNCTDPLVNFAMGEVDCETQTYYVDVNIFSMGSSATLVMHNSINESLTTLSSTGVHAVGPFPAGEPVIVTAQNPENELCYVTGPILVNEPCAVTDCGPTWYERCAGQSETREWLLQGDSQPISVRFPPVYLGWDADVYVFDGADETATPSYTFSGQGSNQVYTSTNAGHDLLVRYISSQYADYACSQGNSLPFEFVAGCADGCTQPVATFAAVCVDQTHFNVEVTITEVGSSGSAIITNDGGAASMTVTAADTYIVGPFTSGTAVSFVVEGANEVCSWTSGALDRSCIGIGIEEVDLHTMVLFPNPNDGRFTMQLPEGLTGASEVRVLDLAGRTVAMQRLLGGPIQSLDLSNLPNGLYSIALRNNGSTFTAKVSIQH